MTISELIERLEALKAEHGDLPVYTVDYGCCEHVDISDITSDPSIEVNIGL